MWQWPIQGIYDCWYFVKGKPIVVPSSLFVGVWFWIQTHICSFVLTWKFFSVDYDSWVLLWMKKTEVYILRSDHLSFYQDYEILCCANTLTISNKGYDCASSVKVVFSIIDIIPWDWKVHWCFRGGGVDCMYRGFKRKMLWLSAYLGLFWDPYTSTRLKLDNYHKAKRSTNTTTAVIKGYSGDSDKNWNWKENLNYACKTRGVNTCFILPPLEYLIQML